MARGLEGFRLPFAARPDAALSGMLACSDVGAAVASDARLFWSDTGPAGAAALSSPAPEFCAVSAGNAGFPGTPIDSSGATLLSWEGSGAAVLGAAALPGLPFRGVLRRTAGGSGTGGAEDWGSFFPGVGVLDGCDDWRFFCDIYLCV